MDSLQQKAKGWLMEQQSAVVLLVLITIGGIPADEQVPAFCYYLHFLLFTRWLSGRLQLQG